MSSAGSESATRDVDTEDIMRTLMSYEKKPAPINVAMVTTAGDEGSSSDSDNDDIDNYHKSLTRQSSNGMIVESVFCFIINWRSGSKLSDVDSLLSTGHLFGSTPLATTRCRLFPSGEGK